MKLVSGRALGRKESESERWAVHMIVKTLGSAWLLLEIRWQKGRQADRLCTCTRRLPTFLAGPSNFLSLPYAICSKNSIRGQHLSS